MTKSWITRCKQKCFVHKDLLHSTGNSPQCCMVAWMGAQSGREWIHVYVWLGPFTVRLKLSQYCLLISYTPVQNKKFFKKAMCNFLERSVFFPPFCWWNADLRAGAGRVPAWAVTWPRPQIAEPQGRRSLGFRGLHGTKSTRPSWGNHLSTFTWKRNKHPAWLNHHCLGFSVIYSQT